MSRKLLELTADLLSDCALWSSESDRYRLLNSIKAELAKPDELEAITAERDTLKARIDGGIRVYAYQDKEDIHQRFYAHTNMNSNATLILDEGVEL